MTVQARFYSSRHMNRHDDLLLLGHSYKQYLAVAPFPTSSHSPEIGVRVARPSFACIEIWSLGPTKPIQGSSTVERDPGEMKCEMVLCIDTGPAHDLKWCPLPSHDDVNFPVLTPSTSALTGA